jgi:hypothetical protein
MKEDKQGWLQERSTGPPASKHRHEGQRRRRDYGSFRPSQREIELLELIEVQYAITLPQLARLIGRSDQTARALRDRWKRARWVDSRKLAVDAPPFVWITGRAPIQPQFRTWDANPGLALHIEAITDIRLLLERERCLGKWECERSIAQRLALAHKRGEHLPDGLLDTGSEKIAIEVELTLKARDRLDAIIAELSNAYDCVWYFAPDPLATKLERVMGETPWRNVRVHQHAFGQTQSTEGSTTARSVTADWMTATARSDLLLEEDGNLPPGRRV